MGNSRGEVNIVGGDSVDQWENVLMMVCLIRNHYLGSAV